MLTKERILRKPSPIKHTLIYLIRIISSIRKDNVKLCRSKEIWPYFIFWVYLQILKPGKLFSGHHYSAFRSCLSIHHSYEEQYNLSRLNAVTYSQSFNMSLWGVWREIKVSSKKNTLRCCSRRDCQSSWTVRSNFNISQWYGIFHLNTSNTSTSSWSDFLLKRLPSASVSYIFRKVSRHTNRTYKMSKPKNDPKSDQQFDQNSARDKFNRVFQREVRIQNIETASTDCLDGGPK